MAKLLAQALQISMPGISKEKTKQGDKLLKMACFLNCCNAFVAPQGREANITQRGEQIGLHAEYILHYCNKL